MDEFVTAYSRRTGRKHRVPRHWIGQRYAADLSLTPRQKAADIEATPAEPITQEEIPAEPEEEA